MLSVAIAGFSTRIRKMADRTTDTIPIPGPPGLPLVGNALAIEAELPLRTFQAFAEEYGKLKQPDHLDTPMMWIAVCSLGLQETYTV